MYIDKSIQYYLDELASKSPTPGGGGVAALAGALACGLLSMTANFTLGKEECREYESEVSRILSAAAELRKDFTRLIDDDSLSYQQVAAAYKLAKVSAEEKQKRSVAIQAALKQATLIPLNICQNAFSGLNLASDLIAKSNPNLLDDLSAAVILFESSFKMALLNIQTNLKNIKDEEFIKKTNQSFSQPKEKITKLKEKLLGEIDSRLLKK